MTADNDIIYIYIYIYIYTGEGAELVQAGDGGDDGAELVLAAHRQHLPTNP